MIEAHNRDRPLSNRSEQKTKITFNLPELELPPKDDVSNICAAFREASSANMLLKLYLSEQGNLTSCHHPKDIQIQQSGSGLSADLITLDSIIREAHDSRERSKKWNWNQRMLLVYRLASSLLQFHSTPWLGGSWNKQLICFPRIQPPGTSDGTALRFDAESPFIAHDFRASPISPVRNPSNARFSLLELGILLLEIWHLTPFEAYAAEERLHLDDTYGVRYEVAQRWLNDTADNILPFYSDPVCRCIEGTFACSSPTLQWTDPQFQASICEGLVKPLWDNCSNKAR